MSKALRLAVASKEGIAITEHFGHAKQFRIYDVQDDICTFLEQRRVDHYCLGGYSDRSALSGILEAVSDCQAVFVAKIGDGPTEKLNARGVEAVSEYAYEEIIPSLLEYASKQT